MNFVYNVINTVGTPLDRLVGQDVLGFKLVRVLRTSGVTTVFQGVNTVDPSIVRAIKVVHPEYSDDPGFVQRIAAEAKVLESLSSQHVVRFYGIRWFEDRGLKMLALELEYAEGTSVSSSRNITLSLDDILPVIYQTAKGLAVIHEAGLVHRDIKPDNLVVLHHGLVKIVDFGIVKHRDVVSDSSKRVTHDHIMPGTPEYLAPEVVRGRPATPASDIYALGVVAYELLLGHHPFWKPGSPRLTPMEYLLLQGKSVLPPLRPAHSGVTDEIEQLLRLATSQSPEARPRTGAEFARLLHGVMTLTKNAGASSSGATSLDAEGGHQDYATMFALPNQPKHTNSKQDSAAESNIIPAAQRPAQQYSQAKTEFLLPQPNNIAAPTNVEQHRSAQSGSLRKRSVRLGWIVAAVAVVAVGAVAGSLAFAKARQRLAAAGDEPLGVAGAEEPSEAANPAVSPNTEVAGPNPRPGAVVGFAAPTEPYRSQYVDPVPRPSPPQPRHAVLVIESITFPRIRPVTGATWDPFGGEPEILVEVTYGWQSSRIPRCPANSLTCNPGYQLPWDFTVGQAATVEFVLMDADGMFNGPHDSAGTVALARIPGIGSRRTLVTSAGASITVRSIAR